MSESVKKISVKKIILATATLSGTIIGVGIFSLPYITSKVGIWIILAYFLILGSLVILVHQFFGELSLKTPDFRRLPGFARVYLGKGGEKIAFISTIIGLFGALLAYLIVGGGFLANLLMPFLGGNQLLYALIYFAAGSLIIYFGIRAIEKIEFWGLVLFFVVLVLIFLKGRILINIDNLFGGGTGNLFFPYGPILFSLWGAALIPEVEEMLGRDKKLLKKIIPISILISISVYLFFIFLILGITGAQTAESALTGLRNFIGGGIFSLGLFFGILTTFTSFITLGLTLKKVFCYDLKIPKNLSWVLTCFIPLTLYLLGLRDFIKIIGFVGAVLLAVEGILILLMYEKIRPERKYLTYSLILVFLAGIIYEIIYFLK